MTRLCVRAHQKRIQEHEVESRPRIARVEVCSVPQGGLHMSGHPGHSHFLPDLDWQMLSESSHIGSWAERQANTVVEDQIMAYFLDPIKQSTVDDECEDQSFTVKATKSNRGGHSNSYSNQIPNSIHSGRLYMQEESPKIAALPRDDSGLSLKNYYESVSGPKQWNNADSSEVEGSSPCSTQSNLKPDACRRLRDESQRGRSRNDLSELGQGKAWLPQGRECSPQGGSAAKKRSTRRHQSLRRMAAIPAASAGVEFSGGLGMRAVFLRAESSRRQESRGTGVFLPPCIGVSTTDFHRPKPLARSIALLPLRIIQVLNLNVENMRCHPAPRPRTGWTSPKASSRSLQQQPQEMYVMELTPAATRSKHQATTARSISQPRQDNNARLLELGLPTEWTY